MPKNNTKTVLFVTSVALVIVVLLGAGYSMIDSSAKIDSTLRAHDESAQAHMHVRHAVTAVSEATGAIQDSLISIRFQLQRIEEKLDEIRDN